MNKNNPFAICTTSVGKKNRGKYEKCVMDIKNRNKMAKKKKKKSKSAPRISAKVRKAYMTIKKHIGALEKEESTHLSKLQNVQKEIKHLRDLK